MNIIEAIRSGKPFKRKTMDVFLDAPLHPVSIITATTESILSDDWEVKPEKKKFKIEFWVNVYRDTKQVFDTKEKADKAAIFNNDYFKVISCEHFEREIEVDA